MKKRRGIAALAFLVAVSTASLNPDQAKADSGVGTAIGGLLGAILNQAIIDSAVKSWQKVDMQVQQCLQSQYGISPADLARRGIGAGDSRVVPYVQSCTQSVAQAEAQREEAARAAQEVERAREAEAERESQQQRAAQERVKVEAAERRKNLATKYGTKDADAIMVGEVQVGMRAEEVVAALGSPQRKQQIPPDYELWVYGRERIALLNGKVTSIQH